MAKAPKTTALAELNQADVAAAISRFLGVASNSPGVAAIASRINVKDIQLSPGGDLAQSGDFQSRILAAGGTELAQITDPNKLAQILQDQAQRANITSAEGVRLGHALEKLSGFRSSGADPSDRGNSGYRLRDLPDSTRIDRVMLDAQSIALKTPGLEWAAHHPDLLRLGPAAMATFAKMKFDRESYLALTRDAGLSPEKAHGLVKAMEAAKVTPDEAKELARRMGATSKGLTPELQEQHRTLMENWLKSLKADPGAAPAELGKLHKWLDERKAADPGKAPAVEGEKKAVQRIQDRLQEERKLELKSEGVVTSDNATRATEQIRAEAQVQAGNDKLAALLGKSPAAVTPAAPMPGAPPPSPPTVSEPPKAAPPVSPPAPTAATPKP